MQRKGILYNKLFYRRILKRKVEDETIRKEPLSPVIDQIATMSVEEESDILLYFKTCSIEREKDNLKVKLSRTVSLREKIIRQRETKFAETFPFYFVAPDLVRKIWKVI